MNVTDDVSDARTPPLPPALAGLVEEFEALGPGDRLQLLVDLGADLPDLPARVEARRGEMEAVPECQAPVFVLAEVAARRVRVHVSAPAHAPTTRGFAAVVHEGLDGATTAEVLAVPDDLPARLGLAEVVSPLRLRGMSGLLRRLKRQVAVASGAGSSGGAPA